MDPRPDPNPARSDRRDRAELTVAFEREARRMGSMATLLNHAVADAAGLHQTDHECIDLLDWAGPLTAGELAEHLGLTSGAVTGLIDRLEAGGWVERERDPSDRRRVYVRLSGRTSELAPLYEPLGEAVEAYRSSLTDDELATVVGFLELANRAVADTTAQARLRAAEVRQARG